MSPLLDQNVASSWTKCCVFMTKMLHLLDQNVASSWPKCCVFMTKMIRLHDQNVASSWPKCCVFMTKMLRLHDQNVASSWPKCRNFLTKCSLPSHALMYVRVKGEWDIGCNLKSHQRWGSKLQIVPLIKNYIIFTIHKTYRALRHPGDLFSRPLLKRRCYDRRVIKILHRRN